MLWPSVAVFIHNGELAETTVSCLDHCTMLLIMESNNHMNAAFQPFTNFVWISAREKRAFPGACFINKDVITCERTPAP